MAQREGLNDVLVRQVNVRGIPSPPERVRFVLDTKVPGVPRVVLADGVGGESHRAIADRRRRTARGSNIR